jgi:hypothetical protein
MNGMLKDLSEGILGGLIEIKSYSGMLRGDCENEARINSHPPREKDFFDFSEALHCYQHV